MNIAVISYDYPSPDRPVLPFVKQLVDALAERGNHCYVIAPFSITNNKRFHVGTEKETTPSGGIVTIYRPNYISFSNLKFGNTYLTDIAHKAAVNRVLKRLPVKPDAVYGHFWQYCYEGYKYAKQNNIPLFVATGESEIAKMFQCIPNRQQFYDYVSGVVCVSSKNRDESISLGLTTADKCEIFSNSVNASLFLLMDKKECRAKLGIDENLFVIAFVGRFVDMKGTARLSEAIKQTGDKEIYSIFIGSGDQTPDCDNILFCGKLPHEQIPVYLNAADVFVLPTRHEGCSNAIVEAMACGLPVISANRSFNWDVLDDSNSIMLDPDNVEEIKTAIIKLKNDKELRERLAAGARKKASSLTIENRAANIEEFIKRKANLNA